jgi:hypothetical protein
MTDRHLNKEGVGLGLAFSKNIANALGGDIHASSRKGVGSEFTVSLPLPEEPAAVEMLCNSTTFESENYNLQASVLGDPNLPET